MDDKHLLTKLTNEEIKAIKLTKSYEQAIIYFDSGEYQKALNLFKTIKSYQDSTLYIERCNKVLNEKKKPHKLMKWIMIGIIAIVIGIGGYKMISYQSPQELYLKAITYYEEKQYEEAFALFETLEENHDAMAKVANMYYEGLGVEIDYDKALEYYIKADELGDQFAAYMIGSMYEQDLNVAKAKSWYEKGANQNDVRACYRLAYLYEQEQNYQEALKWYLKADELGHLNAANAIGYLYSNGLGVDKDLEQAKDWFKKGANQNDINAYVNVANVYYEERNYQEALTWYELAKTKGVENVQEQIDRCRKFMLQAVEVDDVIEYGVYEQDDDSSNGKEKIKWLVVAKNDESILVVSEKVLEYSSFHFNEIADGWSGCELRSWLNEEFLSLAFSDEEKRLILEKEITSFNRDGEQLISKDHLFVFSKQEIETLFNQDEDKVALPTISVTNQIHLEYCSYWTRTFAQDYIDQIIIVNSNGDFESTNGDSLGSAGIRPVMWLSIE